MSATNTTTNYNLPIFIETDKPAWLVDFNGAMRSIDAQMKTNADAIATKSPILTFNDTADIDFTKSGDIVTANLSNEIANKVGRALVAPLAAPASDQVVGINTNGTQENLTVGTGLEVSSGVLNAIDLNLEATTITLNQITVETSGMTLNTTTGNFAVAKNAAGTIAKIYGRLRIQSTIGSNSPISILLPVKVAPTGLSTNISIVPSGLTIRNTLTAFNQAMEFANTIQISPDGSIRLTGTIPANGTVDMFYFPCIYFIKDFGDTE